MIRVPERRGVGTRLELRNPDPAANPYLTLALCLSAGLDGMESGLTPPNESPENLFAMGQKQRDEKGIVSLPGSLMDAIEMSRQDGLIRTTLGDYAYERYMEGKTKEWNEYRLAVSEWELSKYLVLY